MSCSQYSSFSRCTWVPLPPTKLPPNPRKRCPSMPVLDTFLQLHRARTDAISPATIPMRKRCKQSRPECDTTASRYPHAHSIDISLSISLSLHRYISNRPSGSAHRQNPRLAVWCRTRSNKHLLSSPPASPSSPLLVLAVGLRINGYLVLLSLSISWHATHCPANQLVCTQSIVFHS